MQFFVSEQQVSKDRRKLIYLVVFLLFVCVFLLLKAVNVKAATELFYPILGIIIFTPIFLSSYRKIKHGAATYPVLVLEQENRQITVRYKDIVVNVDLTQIEGLRLQSKSGSLVSIILKTAAGETLRFEGYKDMGALADALESLVPAEKVTKSSFFHH